MNEVKEVTMNTNQVDQLLSTAVQVERLNNQVNELKSDKLFLSKENQRLANEVIEVKKTAETKATSRIEIGQATIKNKYDYEIDRYVTVPVFTPITVTSDLEEAKAEIKKIMEDDYAKNLGTLTTINKSLTKKLAELEEAKEDWKQRIQKRYDKDLSSYRDIYIEKKDKLNKKIADLEEELEKERTNKTDKELEAKRIEEIKTLKTRISDLERELKAYVALGFWKRQWYKLTNIPALAKAKEEVIARERTADAITYFRNWIW